MKTFSLSDGVPDGCLAQAAAIYWEAFRGKLGPVLGPDERALCFIESELQTQFAVSAVSSDGLLLGVAGFKTVEGSFVGGNYRSLHASYGLFGAPWRALLLSLLERDVEPDILLMDGIAVSPDARGLGVGTALLSALKEKTEALGLSSLRLDVIDSNPRARALYEREGFVAGETLNVGVLRHVFGFKNATKLVWTAPGN